MKLWGSAQWSLQPAMRTFGPRACEVAAIYVDPGRWRSGVGTSLLDAAVRRLDDGRWDETALWVFRDNPRAHGFYAEHGFAPDGALRRDADDDPPEVRLRRSLLSGATERRAAH
jgi:GNAT superfamily N-acetyltransferase